MINLPLHPIMVHFPIALTIVGTLCLFGARLVREGPMQSSLAAAGTWNIILGAVSVLLTLASGLGAALHLHLQDGARYSVSRHIIWAVCTSQLIMGLAIWRGVADTPTSQPSWWLISLLLIACAALTFTGYHGGENVYHYGIGLAH